MSLFDWLCPCLNPRPKMTISAPYAPQDSTDAFPPRLPRQPPRTQSMALRRSVMDILEVYEDVMEANDAKRAACEGVREQHALDHPMVQPDLRERIAKWGQSVRSLKDTLARQVTRAASVSSAESFYSGPPMSPRPSSSSHTRPPDNMPADVEGDEADHRLSYHDKGKWRAGQVPAPERLSLPEINLDGNVMKLDTDAGSSGSSSSKYSVYYG